MTIVYSFKCYQQCCVDLLYLHVLIKESKYKISYTYIVVFKLEYLTHVNVDSMYEQPTEWLLCFKWPFINIPLHPSFIFADMEGFVI